MSTTAAAAAAGADGAAEAYWQPLHRYAAKLDTDETTALSALRPEECPKYSLAHQLENDWFCYWSEDYGVPKDREANFCFRPALHLTQLGVLVPGTVLSSLPSEKEAKEAFMLAQQQARAAAFPNGEPLLMDGMGSEGSQLVEPFVSTLPPGWEGRDFTASHEEAQTFFADLLTHMGAHPQLKAVMQVKVGALADVPREQLRREDDEDEESEAARLLTGLFKARDCAGAGQEDARAAFAAAMGPGRCAWAIVGAEQLNPVLVLVVKRVVGGQEGSEGQGAAGGSWLAGVLTAVIYT